MLLNATRMPSGDSEGHWRSVVGAVIASAWTAPGRSTAVW